jgi:hypothetical protein
MDGSTDPYLSLLDLVKFRDAIIERCFELNCITRSEARILARDLAFTRRRIAAMLLQEARLELPADLLDVSPPSPEWMNMIAQELQVRICSPQEIDAARRHFCDHMSISMFFVTFRDVIEGRDKRLVFNMDETQLSSRKRFHVLAVNGHYPLVKAEAKLPHLTGVCTISAGGAVFRPIIILKQLKSIKSLCQFSHLASFASSSPGWITGDLFIMFALDFCAQLSLYRMSLPPELVDEPVLLILDGHGSRAKVTALMIFALFNVDVLILPGHTTHVLQALDVGVNSPLKVKFKELLAQGINEFIEWVNQGNPSKADTLRCRMVEAFLNAFHAVTTPGNLYSAFAATGFVPFNPIRAQESPFVADAPPGVYEGAAPRANNVNAELLTDPDNLQLRFAQKYGRPMTPVDLNGMDLGKTWNDLMQGSLDSGRILTPRPTLWIPTGPKEVRGF